MPQLLLAIVIGAFCLLSLWGCPHYNVWQQEMSGRADLAKATYNRQIKVREAEAAKESATLLASAEVERAKGIAEANKIVGESLKGKDEYLRYLWIQTLNDKENEVIYVPTEANLPILEATRRVK